MSILNFVGEFSSEIARRFGYGYISNIVEELVESGKSTYDVDCSKFSGVWPESIEYFESLGTKFLEVLGEVENPVQPPNSLGFMAKLLYTWAERNHIAPPIVWELARYIQFALSWTGAYSITGVRWEFIVSEIDELAAELEALQLAMASTLPTWMLLAFLGYLSAKDSFIEKPSTQIEEYEVNVLTLAKAGVVARTQTTEQLFGIELEFTEPDCSVSHYRQALEMGVLSLDSTVDLEFISVPLPFMDMVNEIRRRAKSFNQMLSNNGWTGNGMHIHVSRSSLTPGQVERIQYLLNGQKNSGGVDTEAYWSHVAKRDLDGYEFCTFLSPDQGFAELNSTRYVLLNNKNAATIEFRMFRSPSNIEGVVQNLMVVKQILEFTAEGGTTLGAYLDLCEDKALDELIEESAPVSEAQTVNGFEVEEAESFGHGTSVRVVRFFNETECFFHILNANGELIDEFYGLGMVSLVEFLMGNSERLDALCCDDDVEF